MWWGGAGVPYIVLRPLKRDILPILRNIFNKLPQILVVFGSRKFIIIHIFGNFKMVCLSQNILILIHIF